MCITNTKPHFCFTSKLLGSWDYVQVDLRYDVHLWIYGKWVDLCTEDDVKFESHVQQEYVWLKFEVVCCKIPAHYSKTTD